MIYLVRHGEAAAGWGDHPDPGLSDLGKAQAEAVAQILGTLGATSAICSPMQRCRETSKPFAQSHGLTARIVPEVSEIVAPPGTPDRREWLSGLMTGTWSAAGDQYMRWREALSACVSALPDHTVVFSHFVAINALCGLLEGDDRVTVFRPGHCSVTQLARSDGRLRVAEYGSESATRVL